MKNKNTFLVFILILFALAAFTTCENPILEKWWVDPEPNKPVQQQATEPDYEYIAITKNVPMVVYETIVETQYIYEEIYLTLPPSIQIVYVDRPVPPEILMQHITIVNIEFIIFSGDQTGYNIRAKAPATTHLTEQEQGANNAIIGQMKQALKDNSEYYLILHGHANPVFGTPEEIKELTDISTARAEAVRDAIAWEYDGYTLPLPSTPPPSTTTILKMAPSHDLAGRMTTKGYGGGRNISGTSSSYAGLNRRVEAILFTIETDPLLPEYKGGY